MIQSVADIAHQLAGEALFVLVPSGDLMISLEAPRIFISRPLDPSGAGSRPRIAFTLLAGDTGAVYALDGETLAPTCLLILTYLFFEPGLLQKPQVGWLGSHIAHRANRVSLRAPSCGKVQYSTSCSWQAPIKMTWAAAGSSVPVKSAP